MSSAPTPPGFPHRHLLGIEGLSRPDIEALLERADACLFAAKRAGRNRTVDDSESLPLPDVA